MGEPLHYRINDRDEFIKNDFKRAQSGAGPGGNSGVNNDLVFGGRPTVQIKIYLEILQKRNLFIVFIYYY